MKPILILSIDGGGLRGVVPLTILAEVQRKLEPKREIWQCFDLISGTSTGGLITSALTMKNDSADERKARYSIPDILKVYLDDGHIIFPHYGGLVKYWHDVQDVVRPKFDEKGIEEVFRKVLGKKKISDCLTNILISTYDLNNNCPLFFKSIDRKHDAALDAQLYDICRATSAGPTYLPTYRFEYPKNPKTEKAHRNCIDGGVYVNNPAMAALAEVVRNYKDYMPGVAEKKDIDFENIFVLSIGTGTYSSPYTDEESADKGLLYWAKNISELMMRGVNKTTDYEMQEMMNDGNYLRLTIDINSAAHAEMSDSSLDTANYLIQATNAQVIKNTEAMQKLDAFLKKSKLIDKVSTPPGNNPLPGAGDGGFTLGTPPLPVTNN